MTKASNPFSSKSAIILQKDYNLDGPISWKGTFLGLGDTTTTLSDKDDSLEFRTSVASTGGTLRENKGLLLAGESSPIVQYTTLRLGGGNDRIINKAKGNIPIGSIGGQIFLRYNGTELDLGSGNDKIETDIIRLRDGNLIAGPGNDSITSTQYIEVEQWFNQKPEDHAVIDMGAGNDSISTTALRIGGRVLMGDGKDTITGLIDDHWTSFDSSNGIRFASIDLGAGNDLIDLRYGEATLNGQDKVQGMSDPQLDKPEIVPNYIDITGGEGYDRIIVSGGIYENIEANGLSLMKFSANGLNFYYKLNGIEEVGYAQ